MAIVIAKCILVVVNVIITILGIVFLAAGLFLKFGGEVEKQVDNVVKAIPDLPEKFNLQDGNQDIDQAALDLSRYVDNIATGMCIGGAFLFLVGIFGCCGVCCKSKKLLIAYIIVVLVLIIIQVAIAGILFSGKLNKEIKKTMKTNIKENFVAIDSLDKESIMWNVVQLHFACCGVDNVQDYYGAAKWDRNRTVLVEEINQNRDVYLETPFSCCKVEGSFPEVTPKDKKCAIEPSADNSNKDTGCYEKIKEEANKFKIYIMAGIGGAIGFQVIILIAAIAVCHSLHRQSRTRRIN